MRWSIMLLTGHQPNYLPYPGFFHKIAVADLFVIVDHVQFVKRGPFGWIHRNRIRTSQGWQWLSVPILTKGKFTQSILEAEINNEIPWRRKHWRSLEFNYRSAPYFNNVADVLRPIYETHWDRLCEFSIALIRSQLTLLGLNKPIHRTSQIGIQGKSTDLIIEMCRSLRADAYLSGIHGRDYLEPEKFEQAGIRLDFQEFKLRPYPQCQPGDFVPNLATLDLIFNCGPNSLNVLMGES